MEVTARREFEEETGHRVPAGPLVDLGTVKQKGGKVVYAWAAEGDLDPAKATSNTFSFEWPPFSGRMKTYPEIDRVEWFAPEEARRRIKQAQVPLLDRLEVALAKPGALGGPGVSDPAMAPETRRHGPRPGSSPAARRCLGRRSSGLVSGAATSANGAAGAAAISSGTATAAGVRAWADAARRSLRRLGEPPIARTALRRAASRAIARLRGEAPAPRTGTSINSGVHLDGDPTTRAPRRLRDRLERHRGSGGACVVASIDGASSRAPGIVMTRRASSRATSRSACSTSPARTSPSATARSIRSRRSSGFKSIRSSRTFWRRASRAARFQNTCLLLPLALGRTAKREGEPTSGIPPAVVREGICWTYPTSLLRGCHSGPGADNGSARLTHQPAQAEGLHAARSSRTRGRPWAGHRRPGAVIGPPIVPGEVAPGPPTAAPARAIQRARAGRYEAQGARTSEW